VSDVTSRVSKNSVAALVNGRVRLRLLEERDLSLTLSWRNDEDNRRWFFTTDPIPLDAHRRWFEQYRDRNDDFVFVIEETETLKRTVGQLSLYRIEWDTGRAEFGRLLIGDAEAKGLGLAQLATACLTDEALTSWGLREIRCVCRTVNTRAIAVCAACGFVAQEPVDGVTEMIKRHARHRSS
jgi:RimJ/RimL family protein N-acetyltransferase